MPFHKIKNALRFGTEQKALSLTDPDALGMFGVFPTATGVTVGPTNAMRVPAVACAVGLISETAPERPRSRNIQPIASCMMKLTNGRAPRSCAVT